MRELRRLVIPTDAMSAIVRAGQLIALLLALSYVAPYARGPGYPILQVTIASITVLIAVYILWAGVLQLRTKRRDIRHGEVTSQASPGEASYRSIDYSALAVSRQSTPTSTPLVIGLTMVGLGIMMALLTMSDQAKQQQEVATLAAFGIIAGILLIIGTLLSWWGWRRIKSYRRSDFDRFVNDNNFSIVKHPDTSSSASFYEQVTSDARTLKVAKIVYELRGQYRASEFRAALVYGRTSHGALMPGKLIYHGVFVYPYSGQATTDRLDEVVDTYNTGFEYRVTVTSQYIIIQLQGLPQDRTGMMRLFQIVDEVLAA